VEKCGKNGEGRLKYCELTGTDGILVKIDLAVDLFGMFCEVGLLILDCVWTGGGYLVGVGMERQGDGIRYFDAPGDRSNRGR
jgi:hypothetical protein